MRKKLLIVCLLFTAFSLQAQFKTTTHKDFNGYTYESVENDPSHTRIYTLNNGMKVYLAQNKDEPRIQTFVPVRTGSNNDPEDNTGLAHYLEHMLFKGTSNMGTSNWEVEKTYLSQISDLYEAHKKETDPAKKAELYKKIDQTSKEASKYAIANEYDKLISSIGATQTNAHTWFDETVYKNNIPANELERWLVVESERFSELVLRLFHTELEAVYEEFNRGQDNDYWITYETMMKLLFPTTHYGTQTTIGTSEHLKNPSMVAIHDYFKKYYVPNNMAVVLVGDLEFEPTIKLVDNYFGKMAKGIQPEIYVANEVPLTKIQTKDIFSPTSERIEIGYRLGGANTKDADYVTLISMLLSNDNAGLIDLNINQKQKALTAGSSPMILKDYTVHEFNAYPNEGQSLDELKDLLLEELDKIKKGEFDEWLLEAVVNDLKKKFMESLENNNSLATAMYNSFIQGTSWADKISKIDDLSKITKAEIVDFANKKYKDNYVVIYKKQGENKDLVRVENPGITPIDLNRDAESVFYKAFKKYKVEDIEPVFVDFDKAIHKETLGKKSTLSFIQNTTNDLSSIMYIANVGSNHDKKLSLAIDYLEYLGTSKYSAADLKKEFYKLGVDYGVSTRADRTFVYLSGLQENIPMGIKLLEHLITDAKADKEAYVNYVNQILKHRIDNKSSKGGIQNALNNYVTYGRDSKFRDIISEADLKAINPQELVEIIHNFFDFNHQIFYYGNDLSATKNALISNHNLGKSRKIPAPKVYKEPATGGKVYFAEYDMVQAEISFKARDKKFNKRSLVSSGVFNEYFGSGLSSIIFQEIRESKSLAYSAYSYYVNASKKNKYNYVLAYVGTQANKLPQAVDAIMELMNDMPQAENQFQNSKSAALKRFSTTRYTKSKIFYYWLSLQDRGINYDINKDLYKQTKSLEMKDLNKFFNKHVKGKEFNVGLIGKKENLDWESVKKFGTINELSLEELFGY